MASVSDMISNLPDSILCHILRFLPTKHAVATSILSRRWKSVWSLVPCFDFYVDEMISPGLNFANIMSRFWALCNVNHLHKFRLQWINDCDVIHVDTCVQAAISRGVVEFDLHIEPEIGPYHLPSKLFNSKTLVRLVLCGQIVLNFPPTIFVLPSLKSLVLSLQPEDNSLILLSSCPVLQHLSLSLENYYDFKIILPTLKTLKLTMLNAMGYKLEINAPVLNHITLFGTVGKVVFLENPSSLVEAVVFVFVASNQTPDFQDNGNRLCEFLRALSNIKYLELLGETTKCLCNASNFDPPMFHNLLFLQLEGSCVSHLLPLLLQRAPDLELLTFRKNELVIYSCTLADDPLEIPKCRQLITFHYVGFRGLKDELHLLKSILQRARVLQSMKISGYRLRRAEKIRVLKKLLKFRRRSRTCQIIFKKKIPVKFKYFDFNRFL